LQHKV